MSSKARPGVKTGAKGLSNVIAGNLRALIKRNGLTQKDLAEELGVAEATMTDYCKGRRLPGLEFLFTLKSLYNIDLDEFVTKSITPSAIPVPVKDSVADKKMMDMYKKYCGLYLAYYFDTSNYKGRDMQPPKDSLIYGVLFIYENPSSLELPEYSCAAIMGLRDRDQATGIKDYLEKLANPSRIIDQIEREHSETAYYGDFELSSEHAFISMRHFPTDKALIILHHVDSNKAYYTGGIGTINSVSKGRDRMPVVQFMGFSRHTLSISCEEIHHSLLLNYPTFKATDETEELVKLFKALYMDPEGNKEELSEYQKSVVIRSTLERFIKKSLERNVFRYSKISERDDDEWYHAIKHASIKEKS